VKEVGGDNEDEDGSGGGYAVVPGKGKRRSLLLINKADLLTYDQR
jgi:large subunit GTPase 1